jgi:hypothetical protein
MDHDVKSQLNRAEELFSELKSSYDNDLKERKISEKTKNLCPEILSKVRNILDQVIFKYFEKNYLLKLSEEDKSNAKVYFPIVSKKEDLKSILGRAKMNNLENDNLNFYRYLESIQPFNKNYEWLINLRNFSNDHHIRLTPQTIKINRETRLGNAVVISGNGSVAMSNCLIDGIPVNSKNIAMEPLENFDPRLNVQRIDWNSLVFAGTEIDILELCKISIIGSKKIIEDIFKFI